jgi:gliding motility-associated-like protein
MPGANGSTDFTVTVTDACGYTATDVATIVMNQTLNIDTLISYPSSICDPNGAVSAFVSGQTGIPYYNWSGPGPNSPNSIDATVWQDIPPGWYYFTVSDNVCEATDSVEVDVEPGAIAAGSASPNYGCAPLTVTFNNSSQNAVSYQWDLGGGNIINTNSTNPVSETYINSAVIMLIAFDALNCPDTTYIPVTVDPCGCTDPLALNYNPIATIEDGSCVYPQPVVDAPNVFTPNGDNENDLFELDHQNAVEIELVVLNRWGNVMYESTGANPTWDGKVNGTVAPDGTYFYKYVARGPGGDEITGHGFVQLIAD